MKYTINVTEEHIKRAGKIVYGDPLILAMRDAGLKKASVGFRTFTIDDYNIHNLPESAVKFIDDFVFKRPISPFTFEIEIP